MSRFHKYILNTKFKPRYDATNHLADTFDNQFPKTPVKPIKTSWISDAEGLRRAYDDGDTHVHGKTLYIAGSHTGQDWWDDFTKIPFWGDLRGSDRYKAAEAVLKANPQIENVVGHSLGGSVALELQKQYGGGKLRSRTYGAPVWDPFGYDSPALAPKVERYRNFADPFSFFDGSANNSIKWNPLDNWSLTHTYENIASTKNIELDGPK